MMPSRFTILTLVIPLLAAGTASPQTVARFEGSQGNTFQMTTIRTLEISTPGVDSRTVIPVRPRSFANWEAFVAFATQELAATPVVDAQGRVVAVRGRTQRSGAVAFTDGGQIFEDVDLVAAYLGGSSGTLRIGDREIPIRAGTGTDVVLLATSEKNCAGEDCIVGESWVKHFGIYHSAGAKTKQTSGGIRRVTYPCCTSGLLVTQAGRRRCRLRNPACWEFNPSFPGKFEPLCVDDPYVFTEPRTCSYETLGNRLSVSARLLFGGPGNSLLWPERTVENQKEVEISEWLISAGLDLGPDYLDDVAGICGFHSSSRGGSARTADGFTGDDDVLCESQ